MKHFYTFIVAMLVLASCSKNDDNSSSSNPTQLTPPQWLYGTWQAEGRDVFRFSEGNVYFTLDENHPLMSFDEYYKLSKTAGKEINVKQKISTNQYVVWEENSGLLFYAEGNTTKRNTIATIKVMITPNAQNNTVK